MKTLCKAEDILKETESMLQGHFELSSGLHSNQYFQCAKLFQYPKTSNILLSQLADKIDYQVDTVIGPAIGGIIVAYEMARILDKKAIFAERKDGTLTLRRGFQILKGERVLIMEDVITTAKSALETAKVVEDLGGIIAGYACIVDRSQGKTGLEIVSLLQPEVLTYKQEDCPLCKQGIIIDKPGSRNKE
jgi:orotate phosphoribosyltransferase